MQIAARLSVNLAPKGVMFTPNGFFVSVLIPVVGFGPFLGKKIIQANDK